MMSMVVLIELCIASSFLPGGSGQEARNKRGCNLMGGEGGRLDS